MRPLTDEFQFVYRRDNPLRFSLRATAFVNSAPFYIRREMRDAFEVGIFDVDAWYRAIVRDELELIVYVSQVGWFEPE